MLDKQEAYDKFYKQSYRIIYRFCIARGQSHADADEITGEALIRLYRKWDERCDCTDGENLKWLYNAAQYIIYEYGRKNEKTAAESLDRLTEDLGAPDVADEADVENQTLGREQYRFYISEVKKILDESEWELFRLAFVEGLTHAEIRERLSVDKEVLRSRLYRMRKKLRELMKELFEKNKKNY